MRKIVHIFKPLVLVLLGLFGQVWMINEDDMWSYSLT